MGLTLGRHVILARARVPKAEGSAHLDASLARDEHPRCQSGMGLLGARLHMSKLAHQTCTGCGDTLPVTREFFGNTPGGGFRRKCRRCMAAYSRAHAQANPENVRDRAEMRRIRNMSAGQKWTAQDISVIRKNQKDLCAYCRVPLDGSGHVDHMTPVAKGGTNEMGNLVLACYQCNTEKHAKTAQEYFAWRANRDLPVLKLAYAYRRLYGRGSAA